MRNIYILRLAGAKPSDVAEVMGRPSATDEADWTLQLEEGPEDAPLPFVDIFIDALEGKFDALEKIGVDRECITVLVASEYDQQCNTEISAKDIRKLGENELGVAFSCWQGATEA